MVLSAYRHLVRTSIDAGSGRHTHTSILQALSKAPQKHNLRKIIGLTCRYATRWKRLRGRQSISEASSVLEGRRGLASGKVARCNLKYAISSDSRIKNTVWLKCVQENQYSLGHFGVSKCCVQFWGLPGTKLPCTTSLYAHHPSWIFGGFGCAVRQREETQEQGHQSLPSEI